MPRVKRGVTSRAKHKKVLKTISYMREQDRQSSAPIIWIISKVINSCLESLKAKDKKSALIKSGVWSSKINLYLELVNYQQI